MKTCLSILIILSMIFFVSAITEAKAEQALKKLSYKQVYLGKGETVFNRVSSRLTWVDNQHYIQKRKTKDGKSGWVKVNALSGKESLYEYQKKKKIDGKKLNMTTPIYSPDKRWIAFTRDKNLFVRNESNKEIVQITRDGSDVIFNGYSSWVYHEEIIGRYKNYKAFWWSPDSQKIVFLRFDERKVPKFTLVRARGVHGELEVTAYPKPGDPNPQVKMGIYHLKHKKLVWIKTEYSKDLYLAHPKWNPESTVLLIQQMNRGQDQLKILKVDDRNGNVSPIYQESQKAWVEFFNDLRILKNNRGMIIKSSRTGWQHLYLYSMKGKLLKTITKGEWRVSSIKYVDEKRNHIYFTGFMKDSFNTHLYRVKFNGSGLKQLTRKNGTHSVSFSPGGRYFTDKFSSADIPYQLNLYRRNGVIIRKIADSMPEKGLKYILGKAAVFRIPAEDGYQLPAKWILPPNFDKTKKYPVIMSVYGGPDSATVSDKFERERGLLNRYYLAQNGIICISVDHRGSGHFGKKGVALMHRKLGYWEMKDYIAAVKWLRTQSFVDPKRIGITGGSYGGYVSALALTKGADYFTHGIAAYSVTDWKLYDSVYTERYMDTPKENPDGYKAGSVMTYADKLKGKLYIVHGEMDDNVHMQNSLQLISKLQDLNKDFEFMIYPDGRHGWGGNKRIHSTRQSVKFWFKHLLGRDLDPKRD